MDVATIGRVPEGSDADVRVYHCSACHHEMRLTLRQVVELRNFSLRYQSASLSCRTKTINLRDFASA